MWKLISEQYTVYYQSYVSPTELVNQQTSTIHIPDAKGYAVGFGYRSPGLTFPRTIIQTLLNNGCVVLYLTDYLPVNPILHRNLIYITCDWVWLTHTFLQEYALINFAFASGQKSTKMAQQFCSLNPGHCTLLDDHITTDELDRVITCLLLESRTQTLPPRDKTLLIDLVTFAGNRGLGDTLMLTPIIRVLNNRGWKIDLFVRKAAGQLLQGNPHINKIWVGSTHLSLPTSNKGRGENLPEPEDYSWHFILGRGLEEYKITRNLGNRIDSLADLFLLEPGAITDYTPDLVLTDEEKEYGKQFVHSKKPTIVLGLQSANSISRNYPPEYVPKLLTYLCKNFNVIYTHDLPVVINTPDVINLSGKISLRQWASVVYNADAVLSMDTCLYWVAIAFKKPAVVLFTTIDPSMRVTGKGYNIIPLWPPLGCKPCYDKQMVRDKDLWIECHQSLTRNDCPMCCMQHTPTKVVNAVKRLIFKNKTITKVFNSDTLE